MRRAYRRNPIALPKPALASLAVLLTVSAMQGTPGTPESPVSQAGSEDGFQVVNPRLEMSAHEPTLHEDGQVRRQSLATCTKRRASRRRRYPNAGQISSVPPSCLVLLCSHFSWRLSARPSLQAQG